MDEGVKKNTTIYISSKSHLNLTFNLYRCGTDELPPGGAMNIVPDDTFTLVYINAGSATLESEQLTYRVGARFGFFSFPDMGCSLKNTGEDQLEIVWLSFSGYLVENYLNRANLFRASPVFSDDAEEIGEKINRIFITSQRMPNRYCRMVSILYDLFGYLVDISPAKRNGAYVDGADFFAVRAVDFIERNYARDISVSEIAMALGISRKHLYSIFNDILKMPPRQYLIYYRIEKACLRLKASAQSISEIADSVGYTNQFYFAKEFKRITGMTPSEYRKNPNSSEVFSYRTFVPTLASREGAPPPELPQKEDLFSVFSPPRPM